MIPDPVLSNEEVAQLRHIQHPWFKATTLSMVYPVAEGAGGLARALEGLQTAASQAIAEGHNILILSDRGISREQAAIPSLLATGAVHHHLTRRGRAHPRGPASSRRATPARCTTCASSSGTARARSIPGWPSRPWTT